MRKLEQRFSWADIVVCVGSDQRRKWDVFNQRYGDWGRDAALWLGRKRGRYTLSELGQLAGGLDYAAVGQAVSRFGKRLQNGDGLQRTLNKIEHELSTVECTPIFDFYSTNCACRLFR